MRTLLLSLCISLCISVISPVVTLVNAQSILPRSPSYSIADDQSIDDDDTITSYLHKGKSYECAILARDFTIGSPDEFYIFSTTVIDPDGHVVTPFLIGNVYPAIAPVLGISDFAHSRTRVSLTAKKSGIYKFTVEDFFNQNNSETSTVRCRETTLYGGYNRFFAGVVIVEINNASDQDIGVLITITNSHNVVVIDNQPAVAKGNTRSDVIFAHLPASELGQIVINHNSPIGALSGTVAEYDFGSHGSIILKRERPLRNALRR